MRWAVIAVCGLTICSAVARAEENPNPKPDSASTATDSEGFVSLFNGTSLDGWVGDTDGYAAVGGNLVCIAEKGGNLFHEREFADFIIRFDFRLPPGANNGLAIRSPLEGRASWDGMELQIIDNEHEKYAELKPWQYHGSVYGIAPAKRGYLNQTGEWNSQEVTVQGRRIKVVLNGETILDVDLDEAMADGAMDGKEHPGAKRTSGHVGFLGHGARVEFRNIRIKVLE